MPNNNMPNYQSAGIPNFDNILSNLNEQQGLLSNYTSGGQIAEHFGFDGEEYGKSFNPVNMSGIQEGMDKLPDLQNFLYGQNRDSYNQNKQGLLGKIGQTNLAGTGSFDSAYNKLNSDFSQQMFGADKQVQDVGQRFQDQLQSEIQNMFGSVNSLIAGGAESEGGYGTEGFGEPGYYADGEYENGYFVKDGKYYTQYGTKITYEHFLAGIGG